MRNFLREYFLTQTRYSMFVISVAIFMASFCCYLFFSHELPITDPVEANYALTAKEMVLTADWLSPRIYGQVWFDKPALFYWLTALAFKLLGFSDLAARITPAFFAALGLVLIYCFVAKLKNRSTAFLALMILGTSLEYGILAKLVITDMVFFVFNSAALTSFYLGYTGDRRWYYGLSISLGLAVLTKGPAGLVVPGLIIMVFLGLERNWAELKNLFTGKRMLLFAIISVPWYFLMIRLYGYNFLTSFLGVHNFLRATVAEHPKDNVSYYYFAIFMLSLLPWSFLALKALWQGWRSWRRQPALLERFCFIWTAGYFVFYSFMATKYVTYTFPLVFPAAILSALYLEKLVRQGHTQAVFRWIGLPFAFLMLGYLGVAARYLEGVQLAGTVTMLLLILAMVVWTVCKSSLPWRSLKTLFLGQLAAYLLLSGMVFPVITDSRSGKAIAEQLAEKKDYRIGMYQFYSTSAVFYSGQVAVKLQPQRSTENLDRLDWSSKYTMPIQTIAEFVRQVALEETVVVVQDKNKEEFLTAAQGLMPKLLSRSEGLSYYYFSQE